MPFLGIYSSEYILQEDNPSCADSLVNACLTSPWGGQCGLEVTGMYFSNEMGH